MRSGWSLFVGELLRDSAAGVVSVDGCRVSPSESESV